MLIHCFREERLDSTSQKCLSFAMNPKSMEGKLCFWEFVKSLQISKFATSRDFRSSNIWNWKPLMRYVTFWLKSRNLLIFRIKPPILSLFWVLNIRRMMHRDVSICIHLLPRKDIIPKGQKKPLVLAKCITPFAVWCYHSSWISKCLTPKRTGQDISFDVELPKRKNIL